MTKQIQNLEPVRNAVVVTYASKKSKGFVSIECRNEKMLEFLQEKANEILRKL